LPAPRPETAADPTQTLLRGITYGSPREGTPSAQQWPDGLRAAGAGDREAGEANTIQYVVSQDEMAQPAVAVAANGPMTMPMRVLLLIAGALAVAATLQYAIFKAVGARRRQISLERGRVKLSGSRGRERMPPAFAESRILKRAPAEQVDPRDIEEGFRQILRAAERRAA